MNDFWVAKRPLFFTRDLFTEALGLSALWEAKDVEFDGSKSLITGLSAWE